MSTPNPTPPTSWGWGRKTVPLNDVLGWAILPWKTIYAVSFALPALTTYVLFGWNFYAWVLLFPLLVVVIALPVLAFTILITSRLLHPDGPGKLDEYWIFNDKSLEKKYKGRKMPIEELYEAYFNGQMDLKNGDASLVQTLYARDTYARPIIQLSHVKFFLLQFIPELLAHTRQQDITQVRGHYDRGDDFYSAFLGEETMVYTSGIFQTPDDTLEQSQYNKLNLIANKIHLQQGEQHLDIGCGWGTLISYYAKHYGSHSTGVTLGKNQHAWANAKAERLGVSDRAQALCMDYRDIPEQTNHKKYDKITCLEMAEHVGVKYFESFLLQVKDMLKDDGLFYLQIAGLRRAWQFEDFCWGLFMGKYVFPGADASCPLGWVITQLEGAGYEIHSEETIGIHYSATIQRWYDNWQKNQAYIEEKYSKWWFRNWSWFLAWAVISPEQGSASCYQIVAHKNLCKFDRKIFIAERAKWKI